MRNKQWIHKANQAENSSNNWQSSICNPHLFTSSFIASIISATINKSRLSRLMPCMYFTNCVLGRLGSGLRRYKYSAICFSTPIKKLYRKDTVNQYLSVLLNGYGAGLRRNLSCFFAEARILKHSGETDETEDFWLLRFLFSPLLLAQPLAGCITFSK